MPAPAMTRHAPRTSLIARDSSAVGVGFIVYKYALSGRSRMNNFISVVEKLHVLGVNVRCFDSRPRFARTRRPCQPTSDGRGRHTLILKKQDRPAGTVRTRAVLARCAAQGRRRKRRASFCRLPQQFEHFTLGPSHNADEIFVYFPKEKVLYAGSILKEQLGNLASANLTEYPRTLDKLQELHLKIDNVISRHWSPVHGPELIDQYRAMLKDYSQKAAKD